MCRPRASAPNTGRREMTAQGSDFQVSTELRARSQQWRTRALAVGIVGALVSAAGFFVSRAGVTSSTARTCGRTCSYWA